MCLFCRSVPRHRLVATVLAEKLGTGRPLRELAAKGSTQDLFVAANTGPLVRGLGRDLTRVSRSEFQADVPRGGHLPQGDGATCQDLQELTYADNSFDIVVTEDVFEHVRNPDAAFAEIARVLRPGGCHIFTVPIELDRRTLTRVDTTGSEDVLLMEPEWHGDGAGRVLSYRTYGYDLFESLQRFGFDTRLRCPSFSDRRRGVYDACVLVSTLREPR